MRATLRHTCNAWDGSLKCLACAAGIPPEAKPPWYQRLLRDLKQLKKGKRP